MLDNPEAIVITYFRDITATLGIPIAVLVYRDQDEVDLHIRKDWQPVLAYDKDADVEFLQSFVRKNVSTLKQEMSGLMLLTGAENSIRAEKLLGTDPLFDQKVAEAMGTL